MIFVNSFQRGTFYDFMIQHLPSLPSLVAPRGGAHQHEKPLGTSLRKKQATFSSQRKEQEERVLNSLTPPACISSDSM